jgi:hypothetical protein
MENNRPHVKRFYFLFMKIMFLMISREDLLILDLPVDAGTFKTIGMVLDHLKSVSKRKNNTSLTIDILGK